MSDAEVKKKLAAEKKKKPRVLRPLGPFESYQSALHTTGMYVSTSITCRYTIPASLTNPELQSKLVEFWELTVAQSVLQHPLLQVGLVNASGRKQAFVRLDNVDLSRHIEWRLIDNLEKYASIVNDSLEQDLSIPYSNLETQPGWRMIVFRMDEGSFVDVMFAWNHANLDGTGGKIFHETLLRQLNSTNGETRPPSVSNHLIKTTVSADNMPPPVEAVASFPITLSFAAHTLWKELKPPIFTKDLPFHATWAPIRPTPYKVELKSLSIDNGTLRNVLAACRTNHTTLTGLLHAIVIISLVSRLPEGQAAAMLGETALNLRRHIPKSPPRYAWFDPDKTVANYVSMMEHKFDRDLVAKVRDQIRSVSKEPEKDPALQSTMWAISATVREEIQQRIDLGVKNEIVGLMKVVRDWRTYVKDGLKKPRGHGFVITNLGVIDGAPPTGTTLQDKSAWSMQRAQFSVSAAVFDVVFTISTITVKGGDMCIDVSWQESVIDAKIGEQLGADLEKWLRHIGSQSVA